MNRCYSSECVLTGVHLADGSAGDVGARGAASGGGDAVGQLVAGDQSNVHRRRSQHLLLCHCAHPHVPGWRVQAGRPQSTVELLCPHSWLHLQIPPVSQADRLFPPGVLCGDVPCVCPPAAHTNKGMPPQVIYMSSKIRTVVYLHFFIEFFHGSFSIPSSGFVLFIITVPSHLENSIMFSLYGS